MFCYRAGLWQHVIMSPSSSHFVVTEPSFIIAFTICVVLVPHQSSVNGQNVYAVSVTKVDLLGVQRSAHVSST